MTGLYGNTLGSTELRSAKVGEGDKGESTPVFSCNLRWLPIEPQSGHLPWSGLLTLPALKMIGPHQNRGRRKLIARQYP